jgi:Xaa-Pro aminopeptidase
MLDRNEVAREKLVQARLLMAREGVDLWVVYARNGSDPSLELLFNCSAKGELLFLIWREGRTIAVAEEKDSEGLRNSGLYSEVQTAGQGAFIPIFLEEYRAGSPKSIAFNIAETDARCDGLTMGLYQRLKAALGKELVDKERSSYPILETLRAVKTPSEIAIMEECCRITCDIYDAVFKRVHAGMSETDVGDVMMEETRKRGCGTGIGDPNEYPLICITRCGLAHRRPSPKNIIQSGDVMVIDFSVRYNGYTSDIARTMYFLKEHEEHAPENVRHVIESAIKAVGAVLEIIRPGLKGYEVDAAGRGSIVSSGYPPFPHSTGHQVGLECHDGGTVLGPHKHKPSMAKTLRVNEVYAIEPTVLQDSSKPSAIVEDNILLTETGYRLISRRQTSAIEIPYSGT